MIEIKLKVKSSYCFFLPTDLTDNLVLEKTVSELRSQLDQSHEREKELESLPVKVEELLKQVRQIK